MRKLLLLPFLLITTISLQGADDDRRGLDFFEAKIRPELVKHCYECHSAGAAGKNKLKGALLLDSRDGSRKGGESGPAVVPGKPDESLLLSALTHDSFKMPPKGKLPDELIGHFRKWIEMGAPDPREGEAVVASSEIDIKAGQQHWAFQPLAQPTPPEVADITWVRTPVDQFVRAQQQLAGMTPNNIADPRTLIRRAYFDLIGLPPQPEDVEKFVLEASTDSAGAYERLIDGLLANEHFGERWARHWLDVTRFAESNGYAFDGDRPNAWHYRDFVIRALNSDTPYNEFVRLQIAGDLLTDVNVQTTDEALSAVNKIAATGLLVAGTYTTQQTQKERERSRYEQLDDIVSTLGTTMLGLTVGCSRCHSHKFDPLPQFDYYRLTSCFADVGFADTGINMQPEAFQKAKADYDAAHTPLVAARTTYEQQQLPAHLQTWIAAATAETPVAASIAKPTITPDVWHHSGPFPAEDFNKAYEQAFEPETAVDLAATYLDGKVKWTPQPDWKDATIHNTLVGDNSANYLFRMIESSEDQAVSLSLGRDDAIKVWVNGEQVLANLTSGGVVAGQDTVQAKLKKGRNQLLMKIVNGGGPSGFYFAATPAVSVPIDGMKNWHHIGPFASTNFDTAFDQVFPPELDTDLSKSFEEGKLKWTEQPSWNDGVAHNDKLTGNNCGNYLFRVIESATPQVLSLSLGSDDGIKLWVNGREVLSKKVGRNVAAAGQETATIQLATGRNEILMKIVNGGAATGFYFAASAASATATPADITTILAIAEDKRDDAQKQKLIEWHKGFDLDWLKLNQVVARHDTQIPKPELTKVFAASVRGTTYQFGEDTYKVYHLRRGNSDNKQDEAAPGFLQVLMRTDQQEKQWLAEPAAADKMRPGRLGLADWLTDVDYGGGHLLARVIVNRLWHHHFGRGIVATPSDFGTRGEKPSHPELLDWLATELIKGGWQLKPIHKLIMTSAVYMQAGEIILDAGRRDPENLLLWRRSSRRMEAEVIRDSLLAVSGTLDRTMFGKGSLDQNSTRRSMYFTIKRSQLIPMLQLFNAPDTMQGIASREESTVAPQALVLLNSTIIRELATKFAAQARPTAETTIEQAIDRAYQIALSRPATESERDTMLGFIQRQKDSRGADANAESLAVRDFCHLILCMNEFVYID
ncbi:MAG: PSD1 and planctomycete cytochrome C domain-containing protein [Fuerstiella sp.]